MKDKNKVVSIAPLHYQYPLLPNDRLPEKYTLLPIDFKSQEIHEYEVLLFHRLLKNNYGLPSEIEWEPEFRERGVGIGREWKYNLLTNSGAVIQIRTQDRHTRVTVAHLLPESQSEPSRKALKEGKQFVSDLLREAQRVKDRILNIRKEFEEENTIQLWFLTNVYLSNYRCAELMLECADDHEQSIIDEVLKYDARDSLTDKQQDHIDRYMPTVGMYYAASISYFFMALEGFVNLLYYGFLKKEMRSDFFDQPQKLDERLDISIKISLMPSLCDGFKSGQKILFLKDLTRLKNYRNSFFHSKLADSLTRVGFVESGFLYSCGLKKDSDPFLPSQKHGLTGESVLEFKKSVDFVIKSILDMMQDTSRRKVETFLLKHLEIPFWRDKSGTVHFGNMPRKA